MERINNTKLGAFRHQLWLEHIPVIDEIIYNDTTTFVLAVPVLCPWEVERLMKIQPFSILMLAHDGNFKLHLMLLDND